MAGCRALEQDEIDRIALWVDRRIGDPVWDKRDTTARNKAIFFFGLYTGLRVSELLSFKVGDVYQYGKIAPSIYLQRSSVKMKTNGRTVALNQPCRKMLGEYIDYYSLMMADPSTPLFASLQGGPITVRTVQRIYSQMFEGAEIPGGKHQLSTHSTRKTFAKRVYELNKFDVTKVQEALGHKTLLATTYYIRSQNQEKLAQSLETMDFAASDSLRVSKPAETSAPAEECRKIEVYDPSSQT